jgi:hypothetical protein
MFLAYASAFVILVMAAPFLLAFTIPHKLHGLNACIVGMGCIALIPMELTAAFEAKLLTNTGSVCFLACIFLGLRGGDLVLKGLK